jgi:hypothetical protein
MATKSAPGLPPTLGVAGGGTLSGGRGRWVDRLAARLDVSASTLGSALQAVRAATPATDRRTELVMALAVGLGRSELQVRVALDGGRPRPRTNEDLADALARELGLDATAVRAAFEAVQGARRAKGRTPGSRGIGQALAAELGVDVARLRGALRALDGPKRGRRDDAQGIATALSADVAEVRDILKAVRLRAAARRADRQEAFAASLAHELGMPVTQVSEALSEMPARRGRRGRTAPPARPPRPAARAAAPRAGRALRPPSRRRSA